MGTLVRSMKTWRYSARKGMEIGPLMTEMPVYVSCKFKTCSSYQRKITYCVCLCTKYKSMGIFQDAQGLVNPPSVVRSGRISNSCETSWLSSLPARMKKIRSKLKALEWLQDYVSIFQTLKGR